MATADEEALLERNIIDGVLVMQCSGGEERYEITKVPAETSFLVRGAKKQILVQLERESVLMNLARTSDFLYLAYVGSVGTELQGRIWGRQMDLMELCAECVKTMDALQQDSRQVLSSLTEANSNLLEAKEECAMRIFSTCAKIWSTLSNKCEKLAEGFREMKEDIKVDAELANIALGDQIRRIEALQKLRVEMEETKKRQEALRDEIDKSIGQLVNDSSLPHGNEGFWGIAMLPLPRSRDSVREVFNLEVLRRDAVEQLAALTPHLQSNDQLTPVEQSAQTALEIATRALDHIYMFLNEAKYFWENMQRFCEKLADPQVVEMIHDELTYGDTPEERIQYYKSERFVPSAIGYLCQWAALVSGSGECVVSADRARRSVLEHIRASPNVEEARNCIEQLQKKLEEELAADR